MFKQNELEVLERAREVYGSRTQITVAAEELIELSKELLKSTRYDDHMVRVEKTRDAVLKERADVEIILNHVDTLFNLKNEDIFKEASVKLQRLEEWIEENPVIEYTMEYRDLKREDTCVDSCFCAEYWEGYNSCKTCNKQIEK